MYVTLISFYINFIGNNKTNTNVQWNSNLLKSQRIQKKFSYLFLICLFIFSNFYTTNSLYFLTLTYCCFNIYILYFIVCMRIRACYFMNNALYKYCI